MWATRIFWLVSIPAGAGMEGSERSISAGFPGKLLGEALVGRVPDNLDVSGRSVWRFADGCLEEVSVPRFLGRHVGHC